MSADNYILIHRKTFEVFDGCASNTHIWLIDKAKSLEEAIDIAEKYENDLISEGSYLEYGIHFTKSLKGYKLDNQK